MRFPKIRLRGLMILVALAALPMGVLECGRPTDRMDPMTLHVAFVVVDAETSRPIAGAILWLLEEPWEGGLNRPPYLVSTDVTGKYGHDWRCSVVSTGNWRKRTYHVNPPSLLFQASAPGYEGTNATFLEAREYHNVTKSPAPLSTLQVKIPLRKSPLDSSVSR